MSPERLIQTPLGNQRYMKNKFPEKISYDLRSYSFIEGFVIEAQSQNKKSSNMVSRGFSEYGN